MSDISEYQNLEEAKDSARIALLYSRGKMTRMENCGTDEEKATELPILRQHVQQDAMTYAIARSMIEREWNKRKTP